VPYFKVTDKLKKRPKKDDDGNIIPFDMKALAEGEEPEYDPNKIFPPAMAKEAEKEKIRIKMSIGPNFGEEIILEGDGIDEIEYLFMRELYEETLKRYTYMTVVAKQFGVSVPTVQHNLVRLGLGKRGTGKRVFKSKKKQLDYILGD